MLSMTDQSSWVSFNKESIQSGAWIFNLHIYWYILTKEELFRWNYGLYIDAEDSEILATPGVAYTIMYKQVKGTILDALASCTNFSRLHNSFLFCVIIWLRWVTLLIWGHLVFGSIVHMYTVLQFLSNMYNFAKPS